MKSNTVANSGKILPEGEKKDVKQIAKYRCTVCGYIYDPQAGDPAGGIKAGTAFESLPDTWICPECGVPKDMFEKV